jgi:hypothetical protein
MSGSQQQVYAVRVGRSLRIPRPAVIAYVLGVDWEATVQAHIDRLLPE